MNGSRRPVLTGGCQCGAVRYALYAQPTEPSICHCRMCQRAFGSYFAPLAGVAMSDFEWSRGEPGVFQSSTAAERGFCRNCGTPLSFRYTSSDRISVSIGSLDTPGAVEMKEQLGTESMIPGFKTLHALPARTTEEDFAQYELQAVRSLQSPEGA